MASVVQRQPVSFDPATQSFNPFVSGMMEDPYPYYAILRDRDPVHWNGELQMYFLSRYADVLRVGRDRRRFIRGNAVRSAFAAFQGTIIEEALSNLFTIDPPDHTRLKGFISKAFTRPRIEALRGRITEICNELLDAAAVGSGAGGTFELVRDFSYPLPFQVICELMGVPIDERDAVRERTRHITPLIDPFLDPETPAKGAEACAWFKDYLTTLVTERRRARAAGLPRPPGLVTDLVELSDDDRLTPSELFAMCVVLFIAGFENVTNLISNALRALVESPDQHAALRADATLYQNLPDEALRYYSTTQYNAREAAEDVEIEGHPIPRGSVIVMLRGAANRDERRFQNPDVFDLRRPDSHAHLGFGEAATFCTGSGLARLETEVAIRTLFERASAVSIREWVLGPTKLFWGPTKVVVDYS